VSAKKRTQWLCRDCGYAAPRWLGRCPECGEFETFVQETEPTGGRKTAPGATVALADVSTEGDPRVSSGIPEFDRVLGGGLVNGSLVLLGGEPGIGKSTLLLQAADALASGGARVLYVCGEESPAQVKLRSERLGATASGLALLPEIDVGVIEATVAADGTQVLVVDSIQTVIDSDLPGAAGSVSQVRACTSRLMRLAKGRGVTVLIVGHVTKEGSIAGPRVLEHMVDTVLYFEGDADHAFRVVRAAKNRFGSVSEIGLFEMGESGLVGVGSPSDVLLERRERGVPGAVTTAVMEGSRPLLVEIQALVTPSYLDSPRRLATGVDRGRVLQVIAVLERRGGLSFGGHDVYVSVAGGVRVTEPGADLALALALSSARSDAAVGAGVAAFGEIGLTGEIRQVRSAEARLREIARTGFERALTGPTSAPLPDGLEVSVATTVADALGAIG
jgi:DNA repair protein RadA/Sms